MATLSSLVDEVLLTIEGYGMEQPRAAFLSAEMSAVATSLTVDSTDDLSEGIAEIGDELVYIKSVDEDRNTVTIAPDGRGYRGSTAAIHLVNSRITMAPVLPRSLVMRKINETIVGTWPNLWGIATTTITTDGISLSYEVPTDVEEVLAVTYEADGPGRAWPPVRRWDLEHTADTVTFPSGKSLAIFSNLGPSATVRVTYRKKPTELATGAADLTTSGLRASAVPLLVAGAVWRLSNFMDLNRLKLNSAVADAMDEGKPVGSATQIASYLRRVYERELLDEQQRLQVSTPPTIHYLG